VYDTLKYMKNSKINEVIVLYNPKSTGDSELNAKKFVKELRLADSTLAVTLKKTDYAGHGEKIATEQAKRKKTVLIVSSSGDGGYHELINGVLLSDADNVITSLLPSGNANDHHRAVDSGNLIEHIVSGKIQLIDVLKVTAKIDGKVWVRYAHSYAGIGLTSVVGKELTKKKLNFFNEKWLVVEQLFLFRHVTIAVNGKKVRYSSLIFSNIDKMSKVIQLSKNNSMTDGKFEVNGTLYRSKLFLVSHLLKAVTIGMQDNSSRKSFEFYTIKKLLIQLDGEDFTIDSGSKVYVESVQKVLKIVT
jgi:diacylglycerol kinase (ATP)